MENINKIIIAKNAYMEKNKEYLSEVYKYKIFCGKFDNLDSNQKELIISCCADEDPKKYFLHTQPITKMCKKDLRRLSQAKISSLKKEKKALQRKYNIIMADYHKRLYEQKTLWFIASVRDHDEIIPKIEGLESLEGKIFHNHESRCWGFFSDLETAMQSVRDNITDMNEAGYYDYVVIEPKKQGLCYAESSCSNRWFRAKYKDGENGEKTCVGYVDCEEPEWAKQIVGWTIS